jgi:hypothetical protein
MIVRVGARLLASPFQLLPLPAWHLFVQPFLSGSLSLSLSLFLSATAILLMITVLIGQFHIYLNKYIYGANTGEVVGVTVCDHACIN